MSDEKIKNTDRRTRDLFAHLPRPVFQYTFDQVAMCLSVPETDLRLKMVWYERLDAGRKPSHKIAAHNIADLGEKPDWRVTETELLRWLKLKGYRAGFTTLY